MFFITSMIALSPDFLNQLTCFLLHAIFLFAIQLLTQLE